MPVLASHDAAWRHFCQEKCLGCLSFPKSAKEKPLFGVKIGPPVRFWAGFRLSAKALSCIDCAGSAHNYRQKRGDFFWSRLSIVSHSFRLSGTAIQEQGRRGVGWADQGKGAGVHGGSSCEPALHRKE